MQPIRKLNSRQSHKFRAEKRKRKVGVIVLLVVSVAIALIGTSALSRIQGLQIRTIEVIGADQESAVALRAAAHDALSGSYLKLFPRSNSLIYPADRVRENILEVSPGIETLRVERRGLGALVVSVDEKIPAALVCTDLPDLSADNLGQSEKSHCYFADETGLIFDQAPSFSGTAYNRFYVPELVGHPDVPVVGQYATSSAEFTTLNEVYSSFLRNSLKVEGLLIKSGGEYEVYVRNPVQNYATASSTLSHVAVVYFNNRRSITEQISNFFSFWTEMADKSKARKSSVNFDYIDVRYGSNVFYRELTE